VNVIDSTSICRMDRSQWPRGLNRTSAVARLLRLWVRIPTGGMDVCLLWVLCVVRWRSLRRADHSPRGVLPCVVCRLVWSRKIVNMEALPPLGDCCTKKKQICRMRTVLLKVSYY